MCGVLSLNVFFYIVLLYILTSTVYYPIGIIVTYIHRVSDIDRLCARVKTQLNICVQIKHYQNMATVTGKVL